MFPRCMDFVLVKLSGLLMISRIFIVLVGALLGVLPASALSYQLADADLPNCKGNCPKVVVATGTISQNEHVQLAAFLDRSMKSDRVGQVLVIDSPGGFTLGGAYMGTLLRRMKMTVIVGRWTGGAITTQSGLRAGTCASACVLVLSGGASRYFVNGSRVGVHRSHTGPVVLDPLTREAVNATVDHDNVKEAYASFFKLMGIDQGLASKMDATPSESMYWLSSQEMAKFRLAIDTSARSNTKKKRQ
ncbi:COG3904 Predicted periplasmic protein [Rhabdaerophilaceae bacterium]